MMRGFPEMGYSPNMTPSHSHIHLPSHNHNYGYGQGQGQGNAGGPSDGNMNFGGPTSPMPLVGGGEGMASIGLTPFTSGSEAATLPQVSILSGCMSFADE
jgi:hypothetical protein